MGKLALVTGSTHGLGKAIAIALAKEGVKVFINGRNEKVVADVVREISLTYKTVAYPCVVDVTDGKAIKDFFTSPLFATNPVLDILVNNVGHAEKFASFNDLTDDDWLRSYDLVFMSAVRFIRESLPFLTASNHGRIINISGLPSHQPGSFNPHYSAAKASMNNLTKHLANMLGNQNILVNAICPSTLSGGTWNQNIVNRAQRCDLSLKEAEQVMMIEEFKKSPLCRMGTLDDVANLVVYLASNKASFQTGHIYDVDGGITRGV